MAYFDRTTPQAGCTTVDASMIGSGDDSLILLSPASDSNPGTMRMRDQTQFEWCIPINEPSSDGSQCSALR